MSNVARHRQRTRHRWTPVWLPAALFSVLSLVIAPAAGAADPAVPLTFAVTYTEQCVAGVQPQSISALELQIGELLGGPRPELPFPVPPITPNPGCNQLPAALSPVLGGSNAVSSSATGATLSSRVIGNALVPERAGALVTLTTSIPMSAPATSVDVSIPYTTAGVYWPATAPGDIAFAYVDVGLPSYPSCSDGSTGDMAPVSGDNDGDVFPFGVRTPAGAGTYDRVHFYCRSGAELVSGLRLDVSVSTDVVSASGQVETASADFQMHDVIATIHG